MRAQWKKMKAIISAIPRRSDLYLSLIDEEGIISSANANMIRGLELENPRRSKTNFFDLLHPVHVPGFKMIVEHAAELKEAATMELYVRNGYYHPMKWQVNYLQDTTGSKKVYFCIGYKIIDDDRLKKYNKLLEKHYQLIMEGLTGIIFHDKNGEIIAANQQTARLLNTSLERLYQLKDISSLWNSKGKISDEKGEPVPFEKAPFMKALQTGKSYKEILKVQLEGGEFRWLLFNSQCLPDDHADGNTCYAVSNIIDITNEKLLAVKVKEKEAVINAFMNHTPNLAWVVDEDSRLIFASNAFYEYFGVDEKEAINRKIDELIPPAVFKALFEKHMEVFKTGKPVKTMERIKMADGTNYISHINIFPVEDTDGKKMVAGHAVHLSDKTRIEAQLREANERLLLLNRAASDAIWEWDMQTGKIFRNEALLEMIGYPQHEDKWGLSWWLRRIHPEDRNRVSDKVKEATEGYQHSWQDEYRFKCADGTYKHIQDKGFIIYENGLPVKMIGSLHDVSDLKELENKLADERLKLQKEISETVIRVQEKERTRIGHELHDNVNQILSSSLLFVDMLIPEGKEQKQIKEKGLQYINMAIEEIRKLSKELVIPHIKEEGLIKSIQSVIDDIHLTNAIRIKFTHDPESDLLSSSKKITLFRIVQEQLKNILTHSKAKNAEILLQTRDDNVQLIIKDNGVGFDPKQTHRGIGLSNIYERVSFYNGKVEVQTARGKGCTIIVSLPLT